MSIRKLVTPAFFVGLALGFLGPGGPGAEAAGPAPAAAHVQEIDEDSSLYRDIDMKEWDDRIRRDKFDTVLPLVMRKHKIDMWIHVMRIARHDSFGAEELGSSSGVFVFTDRGGGRIERAVLGRRWGTSHREDGEPDRLVEESGAYDIIADPVRVQEPVGGPMTEYDYRFKGLREFVVERDPKSIAVNYLHDLGPWVTYTDFGGAEDGLSHTDYVLLTEELGPEYAARLVSSEYVLMDFITRTVPSEIRLLKKMREDEVRRVEKAFAEIEPGVTREREVGLTVFRRRTTGVSQRGRTGGYENAVIQGGDIVAAPSQGMYAYVLRKGETGPPPEIKRLWAEYLKIDKILASTIKAGLTPREIIRNYTKKFEAAGIIVRDNQLHMVTPKNDFPVYSAGYDPAKTEISLDCHGMRKGARERKDENYFGPRIGSLGPDWTKTVPLPPGHHFVLEYFFYMPSPTDPGRDQYLFWWDHEQAIATAGGVEYLSPPQKELYLIR
jgi:hypothetical protein